MPIIPRVQDVPQVRTDYIPVPQISTHVADSSGPLEAASRIIQQQVYQGDLTAAQKAVNAVRARVTYDLNDPEAGLNGMQGPAFMAAAPERQTQLSTFAKSQIDGLMTPRQRSLAQADVERELARFEGRVQDRLGVELRQQQQAAYTNGINTVVDAAATDTGNAIRQGIGVRPDDIDEYMVSIEMQVVSYARANEGALPAISAPPDSKPDAIADEYEVSANTAAWIALETQRGQTQLHAAVLDTFIAEGDDEGASAYLAENGQFMTPAARNDFTGRLRTAADAGTASRVADEAMNKWPNLTGNTEEAMREYAKVSGIEYGTPSEQATRRRDYIEKTYEPGKVRDMAMRNLERAEAESEQLQRRLVEETFDDFDTAMQDGSRTIDQLRATREFWHVLGPRDRDALEVRAKAHDNAWKAADKAQHDRDALDTFEMHYAQATSPDYAVRDKWAQEFSARERILLPSKAEFDELMTLKEDITQGVMDRADDGQSEQDRVDEALGILFAENGWTKEEDRKSEEALTFERDFRRAVRRATRDAKGAAEKTGGRLLPQEHQAIVDRMLLEDFFTPGGRFVDGRTPLWQLSADNVDIDDIPADERVQMIQALGARGVPGRAVTDDLIIASWLRWVQGSPADLRDVGL